MFGAFALSLLVAIWSLPGFLVQDSPLYLYNAHLMLEVLRSHSPFQEYFTLDSRPLPYWGAYALLGALVPVLSPRVADQLLMTLTSVGVATAVMWLRWRIAGWQGGALIAPLVIVLSINVLWMYGLYNFLLGAILYLVTLAYWWRIRDRMGPGNAVLLGVLLVAGYFCHLVSFGLTAIGVVILALFTPGPPVRQRLKWTAVALIPSVPLVILYFTMLGAGGEAGLLWKGLANPWSPAEWLSYVFMADFPTIHEDGMKGAGGPLLELLFSLPPPSRWALIGLSLLVGGAVLRRSDEDRAYYRLHRGWIALAVVLLIGGAVGPSDVGSTQGTLRERVLLLGFATIVPVLKVSRGRPFTRPAVGLLTMAAIAQVVLFWDYALKADRLVGEFLKARPYVGINQRVAAVLESGRWHYRTSPLIHAPSLLGLDSGNLIWNNHAPALIFFPIKYRTAESRRLSLLISRYYQGPLPAANTEAGQNAYQAMMARSHGSIDVLVLWSWTPDLSTISRQWFEPQPLYESEHVKVLRHISSTP